MSENISAFPPPPGYFNNFDPNRMVSPPAPPSPYKGKEYKQFGNIERIQRPNVNTTGLSQFNLKELYIEDDEEDSHDNKDPGKRKKRRTRKRSSRKKSRRKIIKLSSQDKLDQLQILNRSMLKNFQELLKILINKPCSELTDNPTITIFQNENPDRNSGLPVPDFSVFRPAYSLKISQIRLIVTNMLFLLNSLREVQSKIVIKSKLRDQLTEKKEVREKIAKALQEAKEKLRIKLKEIETFELPKKQPKKKEKLKDEEEEENEGEDEEEEEEEELGNDNSGFFEDDLFLMSARKRKRTELEEQENGNLKFKNFDAKEYGNGYILNTDNMLDEEGINDFSRKNMKDEEEDIFSFRKAKRKKEMMNSIIIPQDLDIQQ